MFEPVELPGSVPEDRKEGLSYCQSINAAAKQISIQSPGSKALKGEGIVRPHSSPQEATYKLPDRARMSIESFYGDSALVLPLFSPRSKSTSPSERLDGPLSNNFEQSTLVGQEDVSVNTVVKRPSLSVLPNEAPKSSSLPASGLTSHNGSTHAVPQLPSSQRETAHFHSEASQHLDAEAMYIQQIFHMRTSHDAHLKSLRETHGKEVTSHQSYIKFLENRCELPNSVKAHDSKHDLTIDISPSNYRSGPRASSEASATTLQSLESSIEIRKLESLEAAHGVEALKRKLSLYRKGQTDALEVRHERDQLRDAVEDSGRRVLQLKDIVRRAKESEKALKNAKADLEARLVAANNERIDVLEGYHDACGKVRALSERERTLSQELDALKAGPNSSQRSTVSAYKTLPVETINSAGPRHKRTASEVQSGSVKSDPLIEQLHGLRQLIVEKDRRIHQLERVSADTNDGRLVEKPQPTAESARISELETSLEKHQQLLAAAQADSEHYHSLLHAELRKQTLATAEKTYKSTPKIEAEAFIIATEKMLRLQAHNTTTPSPNAEGEAQANAYSHTSVAALEQELDRCIKEIIMYKRNVRSYQKDLKKANSKIESLEAGDVVKPTTPKKDSASGVGSYVSADAQRVQRSAPRELPTSPPKATQTGLGISLSEPAKTPTKKVASATSAALLSTFLATPATSSTMSSPPLPRPRTPLSTHKKLPKPPSSPTPPPVPSNIKVQRTETQRSLSESIISSYAKRSTPEQGSNDILAQQRDRASERIGNRRFI